MSKIPPSPLAAVIRTAARIATMLLICPWLAGCTREPPPEPSPSRPTSPSPIEERFSEARQAGRVLHRFATRGEPPAGRDDRTELLPFPDGSELDAGEVLAYEENPHFTYVVIDRSKLDRPAPEGKAAAAGMVRRIIHLKPSTFVIDDQVAAPTGTEQVGWRLAANSQPKVVGRRIILAEGAGELTVEPLLPKETAIAVNRVEPAGFRVEMTAGAGRGGSRLVHLLHLRHPGWEEGPVGEVEARGDHLKLTVRGEGTVHLLDLPKGRLGPGHITINETSGRSILGRRPLPSGVLPSGPSGIRLLERWDSEYRNGRTPQWDSGRTCSELKKVLGEVHFRPGKALELGCGTGTNAIYLAGQGFEVTAIDIAPTALSLAEEKARKAGLNMRWLLADVTAMPDLGTFDFLFDRGCYHGVREQNLDGYLATVRRCTRPGTRLLLMAGNANEPPPHDGPPRVREDELRRDFGTLFDFEWLRDSRFDTSAAGRPGPLAWSALLRRKEEP